MNQRSNHRPTLRAAAWPAAALLAVASAARGQNANPALINPTGPAAAPAAAAQAGPADSAVDPILDQLDQRGQNLDSFTADVSLLERDDSIAQESTRKGKVWFQKLPDGSARMRVAFVDKLDEKTKKVDPIDYVLDAGWLLERQHAKKIQVRRQVLRPGEKVNLLKLGEGPFPLPIGQKRDDVKRQFDVVPAKPDKAADPAYAPGAPRLVLRPRDGTPLKRKFSAIDVWVDPKTNMPVKIETVDNKETTVKSTELTNVQVNPKLTDADFKLPPLDETQWSSKEEPFRE